MITSDFITNLINGTATSENPAEFTSALSGFERINSPGQGGFVYGDSIQRAYGYRGATVHGTISGGNAQVELPFPIPIGPVNPQIATDYYEAQARIEAMATLREVIHLAGRNQFSDFALANTVARMRGDSPPIFANVTEASTYWNTALETACKPR